MHKLVPVGTSLNPTHDTAKEGDIDRLLVNCKHNLPFFFSHSKLSKYFIENIDYLLKTQHLLSPRLSLRVLESSFINMKGGAGNNVESDLVQEHSVRNRKDLIRNLGANKTDKAMKRVTNAADAIATIVHNVDRALNISIQNSRHTKYISEEDVANIKRLLRNARPFNKTPGRECAGFPLVHACSFEKTDQGEMTTYLARNIQRLGRGQLVMMDNEEDVDVDVHDGGVDDLPAI